MEPQISVIMPVLNGEKYIKESIDSVLVQTFQAIELIVVDAGSMDRTIEIVQEIMKLDSRVKLLHSQKKSMGYQYNVGINYACGKYLGFVESDDYIQSNKMYEILIKKMEEYKLDYVKGNHYMYVDLPEGRHILEIKQGKNLFQSKGLYGQVFEPLEYPELLLYDANHWKGVYSKKFIVDNDIKFNTTAGAAFQDAGFIQQTIVCAKRCMYLDEHFYCYRRDNLECSTCSPKGVKFAYDEFIYILSKLEKHINKTMFLKMIYKRAFNMFFAQLEKIPCCNECTEEIKDTIIKYINKLEEGEKEGYILMNEYSLERWKEYCVAKCNPLLFADYFYYKTQCTNDLYKHFKDKISNEQEVIICGYGEIGKFWYTFFKCNGVRNIRAICDNDQSLHGKKIEEDIVVMDFESAVRKYPNASYFIAVNNSFIKQIGMQLKEYGIGDSQIIDPRLPIQAYSATTVYR